MADGKVTIDSELNDKGLSKGLKNLQGKLEGAGKKLQSIGGSMTKNLTVPIVAAGTGALLMAKNFDDSMRDVKATMGNSLGKSTQEAEKNFQALREEALRLGSTTAFSASQAAEGMKAFAQVGWDTKQIMNATEHALNMASASGEDLGWTAQTMAATMNKFGMEAEDAGKASDILTQATNSSGMDMQELGNSLEYAGKASFDAGNDLEQTSALLGAMANQGLKGSKAGTALASMFDDVQNGAEGATIDFGTFSAEVYDAQGNMRPMTDILADIEKGTKGMSDEQRNAALSSVFGTQAMRGLSSVLGEGTDKVYGLEDALYASDGAAKQASDEMEGGIGGAIRSLGSAVQTLAIRFGDVLAPVIHKIADFLKGLALKFSELSDGMKKAIVIVGAIVAAIGPLLTVIGTIIIVAGKVMGALAAINPVVLIVIGAITALVAIGVALYQNWEMIKEKAIEVFSMFTPLFETVKEAFSSVVEFIMGIWNQLVEFWMEHGEMLREATMNVFNVIRTIIETVMNAILGIMEFIWPFIQMLIVDTWNAIKNVIQGALDVIMGIVQAFGALFTGNWSELWNAIKQMLSGAVQAIWGLINLWFVGKILKVGKTFAKLFKNIFSKVWSAIKGIFTRSLNAVKGTVSSVFNGIRSVINSVMNAIRSVISSIWNGIKSTINSVLNTIRSIVSSVFNGIRSIASSIWNGIRSTITSVVNGIRSTISSVFNSLKGIVTGAMSGVKNAVSSGIKGALKSVTNMGAKFKEAGGKIVSMIADGIKGAAKKVTGAAKNLMGKVRDFLPFSPAKTGPLTDIDKLNFEGPIGDSIEHATPDIQGKLNTMLDIHNLDPAMNKLPQVKVDKAVQQEKVPIQIENVIMFDTEEVARQLVDPIDSMMASRVSINTLMRGGR